METSPLRLIVPDSTFRLTADDRAAVQPRFDVDALERLLGMMQPSERVYVYSAFVVQTGDSRRELTFIGDPALNRVLGEVWKPYWDSLPDGALADPARSRCAGIEEARARRGM